MGLEEYTSQLWGVFFVANNVFDDYVNGFVSAMFNSLVYGGASRIGHLYTNSNGTSFKSDINNDLAMPQYKTAEDTTAEVATAIKTPENDTEVNYTDYVNDETLNVGFSEILNNQDVNYDVDLAISNILKGRATDADFGFFTLKNKGNRQAFYETTGIKLPEDAKLSNYILNALSDEERQVLDLAIGCPWMNLALAREMILIDNLEFILESLTRKGFLVFNRNTGRWKKSPLFAECIVKNTPDYEKLGAWYEAENHLREALVCYEKITDDVIYNKFVKQYYNLIPFGYRFFIEGKWNGNNAESMYLRGMQCYMRQDFSGLDREIRNLTELDVEDIFLKKSLTPFVLR